MSRVYRETRIDMKNGDFRSNVGSGKPAYHVKNEDGLVCVCTRDDSVCHCAPAPERSDASPTNDADAAWERMRQKNLDRWKQQPEIETERRDEVPTPPVDPLDPEAARARMVERNRNRWRK